MRNIRKPRSLWLLLAAALMACSLFLGACGDSFVLGEGGSGGFAGTAGASGSGGSAGTAGAGGMGGAGGAMVPCVPEPTITHEAFADLLGKPCDQVFEAGCNSSEPVSRVETVQAVVTEADEAGKLLGYGSNPGFFAYQDQGDGLGAWRLFQALWLGLLPMPVDDTGSFFPDEPADSCFAADLVAKLNALPAIWLVLDGGLDQTVKAGSGLTITVAAYELYGATKDAPLTEVRVVSNVSGDFTSPTPTTALGTVTVVCKQELQTWAEVNHTLSGVGDATFALNCPGTELWLQAVPAPTGAGQEVRIGIDPTLVAIRAWPVWMGGKLPKKLIITE